MNEIGKVNFFQNRKIDHLNLSGNISLNSEEVREKGFKDMFGEMIGEINEITAKPDQLTNDMFQGKADIHDVMAAIAQSELTVQAATTVTGKILQTYEKIMQIQI